MVPAKKEIHRSMKNDREPSRSHEKEFGLIVEFSTATTDARRHVN